MGDYQFSLDIHKNFKKPVFPFLNFHRFLLFFLVLSVFNSSLLLAVDFNLRPKAFLSIPLGPGNKAEDGNKRYSLGGGGELGFEVDLSSIWPNAIGLGYTAGLEGGMLINPLKGDEPGNVSYYSIGGVAGLYYFPFSRLFTRIDGAVGVQVSARNSGDNPGKSSAGLFWRGGGEIGFRFTPVFTLAANGGWRQYSNGGNARNSGVYAGLTAQITIQAGSGGGREGVGASFNQYGDMFPVFMQLYQTNSLGTVVLRNNENAEIRNVRLSFRAPGYTASEFPCGEISMLPRGRSAELPLFADFSPEVLRFTDTGRIIGEFVIHYTFLGQERETIRAVTIATHSRNVITGSDTASLAAFVSPASAETLDFARFIAGLSRANRRTGHNNNMQYVIWLLEGLRASSIQAGQTYTSNDEAQYPAETLSYSTGTSRDLALLVAASLESVAIPSAFITVDGAEDFIVALNLGINQSAAETLFNGTGKILVINDEVWLPLSMNAFNEGFMACWTQGAAVINKAFKEDAYIDFILIQDAWAVYPPAPLPELGRNAVRTDNDAAINAVNRVMDAYIIAEINPLIQQMQGAANTAASQNRLGILYTRAGRIADGKAAYERAIGMGSVAAMTNRGNLALTEQDYAGAERWFRQALQREPDNRTALRGIERVQGAR